MRGRLVNIQPKRFLFASRPSVYNAVKRPTALTSVNCSTHYATARIIAPLVGARWLCAAVKKKASRSSNVGDSVSWESVYQKKTPIEVKYGVCAGVAVVHYPKNGFCVFFATCSTFCCGLIRMWVPWM
jgi:hypothetical protein